MPPELKPFTWKQLEGVELADHGKHKTGLIRKLARELRAERSLNRELANQLLRYRSRAIELERRFKPVGRVLIVDVPPPRNDMRLEHGELLIYSDPGIDLCHAMVDSPVTSANFENDLEQQLQGVGERFREMTQAIGPAYRSVWSRWLRTERTQFPNNDINF